MSQLILRPKPRQRLLRWLLLVSPIFFFGPILNLARLCHVVAMGHTPDMLRQLSVACCILAVPIIYLATLIHIFYNRLQINGGILRLGFFAREQVPLSALAEVAGDEGDADNNFQEDLILRFKHGRQLTLPVRDYEEEDLRSFLASTRRHNQYCLYSYADVIPLESRGLFRFLINSCEPDSLIVKLSKTPMQDMILQLIKGYEKNFWTVYALLWLVVVCLLSCYSMYLDTQWLQPSTRSSSWDGGAQLGELGELLHKAETADSIDLWTVTYLRLCIVARVAIDYFSQAGLDVLTVLWFLSGLIMAVIPVSRLVSPTFLFVDSKSLGIGVRFLRWENVKSVTLKRISDTGDPLDGLLTVVDSLNQQLPIDLTRVPEGKKRQLILRLIDRYAGNAQRNDEFLCATNALVDMQFTDLWLESADSEAVPEQQLLSESGTTLGQGRYELESVLGYGGQGTTYLARSRCSSNTNSEPIPPGEGLLENDRQRSSAAGERLVVVKEFVLPNFADVRILQDATSRFQSGAMLLKRLQHRQVVRLWDSFIESGKAYLILEYLPGKTLRELVAEIQPLSPSQVRDFAMQLCDILTYLHAQDPPVIHCDFAPDNLIATVGGMIKLVDFDVARVLDARAYSFVAGRPSYTPPEQFRGNPTVQSDIFALGANIHFLLTGEDPPPLGANLDDRLSADGQSDLEDVIAECLSFEASARPSSAQEVRDRLERMQFNEGGVPYKLKLSMFCAEDPDTQTIRLDESVRRQELTEMEPRP